MSKLSKLSRNKRTESKKRKIAAQPATTTSNKLRKVAKHLQRQPKDLQAKNYLDKGAS